MYASFIMENNFTGGDVAAEIGRKWCKISEDFSLAERIRSKITLRNENDTE